MEEFLLKAQNAYKEEDYAAVSRALNFAREKHEGQKRITGEDYVIHPVAVATILLDLGLDSDTVIAALLHDVLEDTETKGEEIQAAFGQNVLAMVEGVTKLTRLNINPAARKDEQAEQAENIRKLFMAMAKDIRVLLVKLADRLHNMRTLDALNHEKRLRKSRETMDIYAPLAGRLGISNIKCELEDLSMKYLFPDDYKFLLEKIDVQRDFRMQLIDRVAEEISTNLADLNIKYEIKGRPKHFFSIYKKMKNQNKSFEQIYDLVAVRIIVESISDCYSVLGIIHSMWKPIPGRIKDYISSPKPNNYQSLHTTVVTKLGHVFEIQIRTIEMNRIAEYGIAAHWKYKEGKDFSSVTDLDKKLGWIKEIMDVQGDLKDSLEFLDALKMNVSTNEIFVFTPKGKIFNMPEGSTGIDFAYRVHSEVGNKCVGIKINNKIAHIDDVLATGDIVEVLTNSNAKGPSRDWLNFAVTATAKAKIRGFFKTELKDDNIKMGETMLEAEAKAKGYNLAELMNPIIVDSVNARYGFSNTAEMYASIGGGGTKTNQILNKYVEFYKKTHAPEAPKTNDVTKSRFIKKRTGSSGIVVAGFDDFTLRVAKCCTPLPGDKIVGYISRGRGLSVHKEDCPNMRNISTQLKLPASWANVSSNVFTAVLNIEGRSTNTMLSDISGCFAKMGLKVTALNAKELKNESLSVSVHLEIHSADDLAAAMKKLEKIKGVYSVARGN